MLADAQLAVAQLSIDSPWRPAALLLEGIAHALLGDDERADAILVEVAHEAERLGASDIGVAATSERAIIAASRNDHAAADTLARDVRGLASGEDREAHPTRALELAVSARAFLRRGRWHEAQSELASARLLGPRLTHALPWLAVQARLEQTRAYITLRNGDEAAALLAELGPIFGRRPRLGVLAAQADELTHEVETMVAAQGAKESHLTAAEVRLLPLLTTHLSFREISERLFVSRNTVKTQAISVYRKLGVSSRSEAIEEAAQLGLLDVATARPFATSSSMDDAAA
jgi:LuxR family maltose regulon positive regulatory protein